MGVVAVALLALLCCCCIRRRRSNAEAKNDDEFFEKIAGQPFPAHDTSGLGYPEPAYQADNNAYSHDAYDSPNANTHQGQGAYAHDPQAHNAYAPDAQANTAYAVADGYLDGYANDAYAVASTSHGHSTDYNHAAVDYGLQYPPGTAYTTQELQNQYAAGRSRSPPGPAHPYADPFISRIPQGVAHTPADHGSSEPPRNGSQDSFFGRGQ